jgi:drug/metabolite transporter (DMT)-like permease
VAYTTLSFLIVIATSAWEICTGTMPLRTYLFGLRPGYYAAIAVKSFVIFVAWICGFRALRKMPVSVYGILDMARVVFSALLGILILGERPSLMQAGGIVLVCLGLFLLRFVKEDEPTNAEEGKPEAPAKHKPGFYVALAMVSCFLNAVSGNMDKILMKDDRMSSGQLQLWYMFFLVAFYVIYTLARRIHLNFRGMLKNPWIWGLSILFVIADRALFIANGYAESRVIVMTVLKQACTIVTILGGWLVFREKKILRKLLCAAVVIAGIVLSVC